MRVLACNILHFISLNLVETFILHVNNKSVTGPLIIGTWRNGSLARNDWKGTQTTKRHFCSPEHFVLSEGRSLTYFLKCQAAYRKLFPLFVSTFNPHKIIQKCCLWGEQEAERRRANLKQWIPAHTPTHGLASTSCLSIAISLHGKREQSKKNALNVIGGLFVLKLYLLEVK